MARAIYPVHTPLDGDIVFALSTAQMAKRYASGDLDPSFRGASVKAA